MVLKRLMRDLYKDEKTEARASPPIVELHYQGFDIDYGEEYLDA